MGEMGAKDAERCTTRQKVLVLNLDAVKAKNLYQYDSLRCYGYEYIVFSYAEKSSDIGGVKSCDFRVYKKNFAARMAQMLAFLLKYRAAIHHVELYTGCGSFLAFEYALATIFRLPICVVERGSPLKDVEHYTWWGRGFRKYLYKSCRYLWIRELWMTNALKRFRVKPHYFLSNAVTVPKVYNHEPDKEIDFIWCNTVKPWRNVAWYVDALKRAEFNGTRNLLVGLIPNPHNGSVIAEQAYITGNPLSNLQILNFQRPGEFYRNSKYFVLPADIVYLNFSLLEAMSYGVVPIVSNVEGATAIIDNRHNGLLVSHNKEAFCAAMLEAMALDPDTYRSMSVAARIKAKQCFSIETWARDLAGFYHSINGDEHSMTQAE